MMIHEVHVCPCLFVQVSIPSKVNEGNNEETYQARGEQADTEGGQVRGEGGGWKGKGKVSGL